MEVDKAQQNVSRALDRPAGDAATNTNIGQSNTCVTHLGVCSLSNSALNGMTCFCDIGGNPVLGRTQ
jgi:hypothetical protein